MAEGVVQLTNENFQEEVLNSSVPVVVDFWATWCMPCKMIAPLIEEIAREYQGRLKVAKLNVDEAMETATRFGVMNIPTLIFFKGGQEVSRSVGVVSKDVLEEKIKEVAG